MEPVAYTIYHLVKSEDLNHHGTLYAGRNAEWFVEAGFVAAASLTSPQNIVCLKIHGLEFTRPVRAGEIACFHSKIILTGRSRIVAHIKMSVNGNDVVKGFITFVHVDENGRALPHGITITTTTPEDLELQKEAENLR